MRKISSTLKDLTLIKILAFLAGASAVGVVVWFCLTSEAPYLGLLALVGAIAGWIVGVLAAPFSSSEKQHFSELAKVISGFVTGYLLSKLDPIIAALLAIRDGGSARIMESPYPEQVLITLASFGIALLFVFSARLYWSDEGNPQPQA